MAALTVAYRDINELIPYAKNSRTHSPEQILQIAGSIKEFGFTNPVLIDESGGIIAGHGRVLAASRLNLLQVPTITLSHLTETQKRAYIIADNKLALNAGWDEEVLALELEELKLDGFDLELTGFTLDEIEELSPEQIPEGLTDEDHVPEVQPEPISKLGDIWLLGKHRVMCGDSTSIDAVEKLMAGEKAALVVTDPPWNVAYGTNLANNAQGDKARTIMNDSMDSDKWDEFLSAVVGNLSLVTLPGCPLYCVMGPSEWPAIDKALRGGGFHWSSTIIWAKDQLVMSRKDYHTQYEPIWYGWNDKAARLWTVQDRKQSDLWECKRPKSSPLHPTTKPVELIERAVLNSSNAHSIVFEPFGGSGSTLIACEKTGREARLMELDGRYVDVILKRWAEFTGKDPVLESTGQLWSELSNVGHKG
ncbi:MAG: site-specific DNA-methyltransferase [Thiobacillus sp.]